MATYIMLDLATNVGHEFALTNVVIEPNFFAGKPAVKATMTATESGRSCEVVERINLREDEDGAYYETEDINSNIRGTQRNVIRDLFDPGNADFDFSAVSVALEHELEEL